MLRLALYQYDTKKKQDIDCRFNVVVDLEEEEIINRLRDLIADVKMKDVYLPMVIGDLTLEDVPNLTLIKGGKNGTTPKKT